MTSTHLCILLLAIVAAGTTAAAGQTDDIPIENDNQFPPEDHWDSIDGTFNKSSEQTTQTPPEELQTTVTAESSIFKQNTNLTMDILPEEVESTTLTEEFAIFKGDAIITTQKQLEEIQPTTLIENGTTFEQDASITTQIPLEEVQMTTVTELENDNNITTQRAQEEVLTTLTEEAIKDDSITTKLPPEDEQTTTLLDELIILKEDTNIATEANHTCPCLCHFEDDNVVINCEGYNLEEFPSNLHPRTTTLNLKNNKLTEIPKDVAALKFLKILNAENNLIMDISTGSVSELAELVVLNLASNRLIEYPKDLENSLSLTNLEELDLSNNDIRELKAENFANLRALKKLSVSTTTPEFLQDLCKTFQNNLETICTDLCLTQSHYCQDNLQDTLPGTISYYGNESSDPVLNTTVIKGDTKDQAKEESPVKDLNIDNIGGQNDSTSAPIGASRNAVPQNAIFDTTTLENDLDETTKTDSNKNEDIKVGATTDNKSDGGVDKSVIGMIVAGMIVVVAVIVIKKNWSSITKRCSSTSRPHERTNGANTNGITPEEVPLQDKEKSPV